MKKYKVIICIPTYFSVHAELLEQFITLGSWASSNDYPILTIFNKSQLDAKNWLATGGGGLSNSKMLNQMTDTLVWINSNIVFNTNQIEQLIDNEHPFVSATYYKDGKVDAGKFNEGEIKYLTEQDINDARGKTIPVDYVGFGFCKTASYLFEKMSYPYFTNKVVTIKKNKKIYTDNVSEDMSFCMDSTVKPVLDTKIDVLKYNVGGFR